MAFCVGNVPTPPPQRDSFADQVSSKLSLSRLEPTLVLWEVVWSAAHIHIRAKMVANLQMW